MNSIEFESEIENLKQQIADMRADKDTENKPDDSGEIEVNESNRKECEEIRKNYRYNKHYIYHPTKGEELVDEIEYKDRLENGWYKNKADFPVETKISESDIAKKNAEIENLRKQLALAEKVMESQKNMLEAQEQDETDKTTDTATTQQLTRKQRKELEKAAANNLTHTNDNS